MKITKIRKSDDKPEIKQFAHNAKGELVEAGIVQAENTPAVVNASKGIIKPEDFNYLTLSKEQQELELTQLIQATNVIKSKMISGVHYAEVDGVEKPIILKEGTAWIATATKMDVKVQEVKYILDHERQFYLMTKKAIASWGSRTMEAIRSANTGESNNDKKLSEKTNFYTIMGHVDGIAETRARNEAIKLLIALTGVFETNEENPRANKAMHQAVYTSLYRQHLAKAPEAPKKKKNGKGVVVTLTEPDRLTWRKEWVRAKILQPNLIKLGIHAFEWGTKDIEQIKKEMPTWSAEGTNNEKN